jgi:hypothetical protein
MAMPETTQKSLNFDTTIERAGRNEKSSLTISAKPVGVGAVSQQLILPGEQSGLLMHTVATESVSLYVRMISSPRFWNWKSAIRVTTV